MTRESTKSVRASRKPLHQRGPQSINGDKDSNFEYRFVNDTGARIQNFKEAGYELVSDDELIVGDARVKDSSDFGSTKRVISNDGTISYLMRVKKEWYKEDQAAKLEQLKEQESSMKQNASQDYGTLKLNRD